MKRRLTMLAVSVAVAAAPTVAGRLGYDEPVIGLVAILIRGAVMLWIGIRCGTDLKNLWYMPFACEGVTLLLNWSFNGWWYWEYRFYRICFYLCIGLMLAGGAIGYIASTPGKKEA